MVVLASPVEHIEHAGNDEQFATTIINESARQSSIPVELPEIPTPEIPALPAAIAIASPELPQIPSPEVPEVPTVVLA
ncbi:hypothetical protein HGRIS_000984 [Hohenbuehelia grisea]|uniref:Uncharacterized protein n=1 Tax=Hohenbuehelia grisea TaxID=104357 RepID=A0ABR3IQD2_9AGAR